MPPVDFDDLRLSKQEREWLAQACPFFKDEYLVYLAQYRFKPEQVTATFHPKKDDPRLGRLQIEATGPWHETILWEVPLMAALSELFFTTVDTDWSYDGQEGMSVVPLWLDEGSRRKRGGVYKGMGVLLARLCTQRVRDAQA